jgi:O-antigen/teichoic acid export membrane protein
MHGLVRRGWPTSSSAPRARRTVANAIASAGSHAASTLVLLAITPFAVASLGLAAYGLWALVSVVVRFALLADFGLGPALTKYVAEHATRGDRERARGIVTVGALYYLALAALAVPVAFLVGPHFADALKLSPELRAQAPSVLVGGAIWFVTSLLLWTTISSFVNGLGHLRVTAASGAIGQFVAAFVIVVLLAAHVGIWSMIIGLYVQVVVQSSIVYIFALRTFGPIFISPFAIERSSFRLVFTFGGWIQVTTTASLLGSEAVQLLVGTILGVESVALFDLGSRLARAVRVLAYHLNAAFLPAVSAYEVEHGTHNAQNVLADASRYAAFICFGAAGLLVAIAPLAPRAWLGPRAPHTGMITLVVAFLALTYLTDNLASVAATTMRALGKPWVETTAAIVYALSNVGLVAFLAPRYGLPGVLVATLTSSIVGAAVFFAGFARVRRDAVWLALGGWTLRLAAACLVAVGVSTLVAHAIPQGERVSVIVATIVAAVVYAIVFAPALRVFGFFGARDVAFARRLLPMRIAAVLDTRAARLLFGTA